MYIDRNLKETVKEGQETVKEESDKIICILVSGSLSAFLSILTRVMGKDTSEPKVLKLVNFLNFGGMQG